MTVSLRRCPWCKVQALAPSWCKCPRCGGDVSLEAVLTCQIRGVPGTAAPEVQARHPEKTLRAAMLAEKRIARNLDHVEAAWLVLKRAGCSWERVEAYLRRRKVL